jgi:multiple antibiotic resistance protein
VDYQRFLDGFLLFIALINPISKLLVVSIISQEQPYKRIANICIASTGMAALILLAFASAGRFLFVDFLHIHLYSLQVVGGGVLIMTGFNALEKGHFLAEAESKKLSEVSLVPLASPLIAGPATITASISQSSIYGFNGTASVLGAALLVNLVVMLTAPFIAKALERFSILGPLIRITGMIVMALGVEMGLQGVGDWWVTVRQMP